MAKSFRELVGVPPSTASTQDSVLVIIDAQNEYATGHLQTANVSSTRKAIASLLEKYRAAGGHIAHVFHRTPEGAPVFTPSTTLSEPFPELQPLPDEKIVWKEQVSALQDTDLGEYIKSTGKGKVVLVGYMAHVCVSTTARHAGDLGLDVVLASDAIGDRDIPGVKADELVRITLAELADAFGTVVEGKDIA
ncbi:Isochorismatase-like protein [Xylogone sp. PMI_703]|nr:Isochorismatase-like protein [Xylogone sp. PMI_703]